MERKSTKADSKQFKDMNLNNGDEVDGCHQSKAGAQDSGRMDCSISQGKDMNSQPATQPLDGSFEMEEGGHMEGGVGTAVFSQWHLPQTRPQAGDVPARPGQDK